ncbi:hypothetical protein D026_3723, partial [Vibrio parahaemolyticus 605]
QNVVEVYQLP